MAGDWAGELGRRGVGVELKGVGRGWVEEVGVVCLFSDAAWLILHGSGELLDDL